MFSAEDMGRDQLTLSPDGRGFINVHGKDTKLSKYYSYMLPMQYIGFKDNSEKEVEIYENDIIEWPLGWDDKTLRGVVVWHFDQWRICFVPCDCCKSYTCENYKQSPHSINQKDWQNCKVIGNIHQNPELLGD